MEDMSTRKVKLETKTIDELISTLEEFRDVIPGELSVEISFAENHEPSVNDSSLFGHFTVEDKNYNRLSWIIEAIILLAHKSPAIKFESDFFYNALEVKEDISPEHAILTMLSESYYSEWEW